jgi:hypothetical protein
LDVGTSGGHWILRLLVLQSFYRQDPAAFWKWFACAINCAQPRVSIRDFARRYFFRMAFIAYGGRFFHDGCVGCFLQRQKRKALGCVLVDHLCFLYRDRRFDPDPLVFRCCCRDYLRNDHRAFGGECFSEKILSKNCSLKVFLSPCSSLTLFKSENIILALVN